MAARPDYRNLLAGAALLALVLPGCEPSFPAPRNGYNLEPYPQGPKRLPAPTVVAVPDCPWRATAVERTELVLEIDGPAAVNQAFSFQGRIDEIPQEILQIFVMAGFSRDRQGNHWQTGDVVSLVPQDGSIDYRVDVRAPPKTGNYYVLLFWDDGNDTKQQPFASAEVAVKEK
jgi:hypothetical protein